MKITKNTGIMEALEKNPNAVEIFVEAGMHCIGCAAASFETIEEGCLAHGMTKKQIDNLIKKLNKNELQ